MATCYTEEPHNFAGIEPFVVTDTGKISGEIFSAGKCFFYDTCSFRAHANLKEKEADYILQYMKQYQGIVVITRCVLMELASHSGILNPEYIEYIKLMDRRGLKIVILYEEDLFSIMGMCFSTNQVINQYLMWAVRMISKNPVSGITETLENDKTLRDEVVAGKDAANGSIYKHFFSAVRANKESKDNLGEELIGICLYLLSYLPGESDGKFCVLTEDKGAAAKIDSLYKRTPEHLRGKKYIIYSTPKLAQVMYREHILTAVEDMKAILHAGNNGELVVLGMGISDLENREISIGYEELTERIMEPNAIHITF